MMLLLSIKYSEADPCHFIIFFFLLEKIIFSF